MNRQTNNLTAGEEKAPGWWHSAGLGGRVASLDWVVKDGFLEEVPLELKRKKRSRISCVSWPGPTSLCLTPPDGAFSGPCSPVPGISHLCTLTAAL